MERPAPLLNESAKPTGRHYSILALAWAGWLFDFYDLVLFSFLVIPIRRDLGLSETTLSFLLGASLGATAIGGVVFGWLADRLGRKPVLSITILTYSLGTLLCGLAPGLYSFLLFRVITGLGVGGEWATGQTLIGETFPARLRARFAAVMQTGAPVGVGLAAIVGGFVEPHLGWRLCFVLSAAPALLVVGIRRAMPESDIWIESRKSPAEPHPFLRALSTDRAIRRLFVLGLVLAVTDMSAYWFTYLWMPKYLYDSLGFSMARSGAWILVTQMGGLLGYLSFGAIADWKGRRLAYTAYSFVWAGGLLSITWFWSSLAAAPAAALLCMFLIGVGTGNFSGYGPIFSELFPTSMRSTAMGTAYNVARGIQFVTPLVITWVAATSSAGAVAGLGRGISIGAIFAVATGLWVWTLPETKGTRIMPTRIERLSAFLLICAVAVPTASMAASSGDLDVASAMRWRLVGPFRGGRAVTATGVRGKPNRFYFGAVGGGVWRTDNAGRTWEPIFDDQPIASIGAIAVAPSNPDVLYVGSGEADMRSDISHGNGMYKSADAGKTWTRIGLADTRQIGRIGVDPDDPEVVFVAALGHGYGPNEERGVFRSKDGGKTWTKVLYKDADTGAVDLALDPGDKKTVLAALWQTRRPPWSVYPPSNGPGSGLYRSVDGGDTWKQVTDGLPSEKVGRIRIAFAPSAPRRVYAIVDAKDGGLFVSEDAGASWKRASSDKRIWERGWYFGGVSVDPKNADVVYACSVSLYRSTDGGKTFLPFKGAPGGDDYHRLWIDPDDPSRMILASDQGAVVTVDGGKSWSSWYNQPTAQFYHVATDDRFPYWIYGAQQDSGAAAVPVRTDYRTISQRDWNEISAGGESGFLVPDPKDANIVWGGTVGRFDWRTLQDADLDPTLAYPDDYRGEWTLPLAISPRDGKTLYFGRQILFRSKDAGAHWDKASPDLTRESPAVPASLDPITAGMADAKGPRRGVIYAIAPSPLSDGLIWCGTDDGQIWLTRDDGKSWINVTPPDLSAWSKVGIIEPSHFDAATAYVAIDRHRLDDHTPVILRTRDGGKSWATIAHGIPDGSFLNVVREDPVRRGLLYAGTETGVFISLDDGENWRPLKMNLPNCSIRDIDVRHGDLVVATHGRSFWVLDDLSPLRQFDAIEKAGDLALAAPRAAVRLNAAPFQGTPEPKDEPMAENPPPGAVLDYLVRTSAAGPLVIEILDAKGELVRRFASDDEKPAIDLQRLRVSEDWEPVAEPPGAEAGMHRFVWDLHYPLPKELARPGRREFGPWAPPGRYTVRLSRGGKSVTQPLAVTKDPRLPASITDADLFEQCALSRELQAERLRVASALREAASLRKQIAAGKSTQGIDALSKSIDRAAGPASSGDDFFDAGDSAPTSLRRVATSLSSLQRAIESADMAPTSDMRTGFEERKKLEAKGLADWKAVLDAAASAGLRP